MFPPAERLRLPTAILAALLVGFLLGLLPCVLKVRYQASEIVTTLMLNVIAVQLYRLMISEYMNDPAAGFPASPWLPEAALFPLLIERTDVTAMLFCVPLAALAVWLLLMSTTVGFEIRSVGAARAFAHQAGMPVTRAILMSTAPGGVFAGLAGLPLSNALLKRLPVGLAPGMASEGWWRPCWRTTIRNTCHGPPASRRGCAPAPKSWERTTDVSREVVLVILVFINQRHAGGGDRVGIVRRGMASIRSLALGEEGMRPLQRFPGFHCRRQLSH